MPRGQRGQQEQEVLKLTLAERIAEQQKKVEAKEKSLKDAKAKLTKLQAEENNNLISEIAALAKAENMTLTEYLKSVAKK